MANVLSLVTKIINCVLPRFSVYDNIMSQRPH